MYTVVHTVIKVLYSTIYNTFYAFCINGVKIIKLGQNMLAQ